MKALAGCSLLSLLFAVACGSKPGSDLFSSDAPSTSAGSSGGSGSVTIPNASSGSGATTLADGGSKTSTPAAGGASPSSGGMPPATAGGANPDPPSAAAGASDMPGAGGAVDIGPELPVCGNGVLEAGEECDDAGHEGKDGCSAACKVSCADFGPDTTESDDHHCYGGYDQADFEDAELACKDRGAHLVSISSAAENALAQHFVRDSKWIGGFEPVDLADGSEGTYEWTSGEAFSYQNWGGGQPDRAESRCTTPMPGNRPGCYQHCAALMSDGKWADERCDAIDGYVCEWEPAGS
jgi:cysteine-rich repeat protein